jgi:DNA helicase-4
MNYRSVKTIVDAGVKLIKNNGECQIPKTLKSNGNDERPIQVLRSPHQANYRKRYFEDTSEDCLYRIEKYRKDGILPKDILVLTRFMRTRVNGGYKLHQVVKILKEKAEEMGIDLILDEARDQSKIRVLTVHKSKGLEAKVVFILNVIKDTYGFPCEMEDNSVYASAMENYPEQKSIEEERRLFYVAMTRAREDLIIYTWEHSKSEFLYEIENFAKEERLSY